MNRVLPLFIIWFCLTGQSIGQVTARVGIGKSVHGGSPNLVPKIRLPQQESLIHYWKLNEAANSGRADSIGSSHFIENLDTVPSSVGINGNGAGQTINDDDLSSTGVPLGIGNNKTFTFWLNMDTLPATKCGVFRYANFNYPVIEIFGDDDTIRFTMNTSTVVISIPYPSLDAWHMFALVTEGATWKVSVDGGTFTTGAGFSLSNVDLGVEIVFVTTDLFTGIMDELAIWNTALSQSEVAALWNGGAGFFLP